MIDLLNIMGVAFILHTISALIALVIVFMVWYMCGAIYDYGLIQSCIISYIVTFVLFVIFVPYIIHNNK